MKIITVRTIHGFNKDFFIQDDNQYSDFIEKVSAAIGIDEDKRIKLMHKGKILTEDSFNMLLDKSILLCLIIKSADIDKNAGQNVDRTTDQNVSESQFKQFRASLIVFMDLVRNNPQLKNLYNDNYGQFVNELINNPLFENIMKNILSQSGQIVHSIETKQNIKVNISGDSAKVDVIELTKEEEDEIKKIVDMGFDTTNVIKTYIQCGKNTHETMRRLVND